MLTTHLASAHPTLDLRLLTLPRLSISRLYIPKCSSRSTLYSIKSLFPGGVLQPEVRGVLPRQAHSPYQVFFARIFTRPGAIVPHCFLESKVVKSMFSTPTCGRPSREPLPTSISGLHRPSKRPQNRHFSMERWSGAQGSPQSGRSALRFQGEPRSSRRSRGLMHVFA